MKITVEGGADFLYVRLTRNGEHGESCVITVDGKARHNTFPMPQGDGVLVLHV